MILLPLPLLLTLIVSVSIFYYHNPMTFSHFIGLFIAFLGVSWYTKIKVDMKNEKGGDLSEVDRMELGLKAFN